MDKFLEDVFQDLIKNPTFQNYRKELETYQESFNANLKNIISEYAPTPEELAANLNPQQQKAMGGFKEMKDDALIIGLGLNFLIKNNKASLDKINNDGSTATIIRQFIDKALSGQAFTPINIDGNNATQELTNVINQHLSNISKYIKLNVNAEMLTQSTTPNYEDAIDQWFEKKDQNFQTQISKVTLTPELLVEMLANVKSFSYRFVPTAENIKEILTTYNKSKTKGVPIFDKASVDKFLADTNAIQTVIKTFNDKYPPKNIVDNTDFSRYLNLNNAVLIDKWKSLFISTIQNAGNNLLSLLNEVASLFSLDVEKLKTALTYLVSEGYANDNAFSKWTSEIRQKILDVLNVAPITEDNYATLIHQAAYKNVKVFAARYSKFLTTNAPKLDATLKQQLTVKLKNDAMVKSLFPENEEFDNYSNHFFEEQNMFIDLLLEAEGQTNNAPSSLQLQQSVMDSVSNIVLMSIAFYIVSIFVAIAQVKMPVESEESDVNLLPYVEGLFSGIFNVLKSWGLKKKFKNFTDLSKDMAAVLECFSAILAPQHMQNNPFFKQVIGTTLKPMFDKKEIKDKIEAYCKDIVKPDPNKPAINLTADINTVATQVDLQTVKNLQAIIPQAIADNPNLQPGKITAMVNKVGNALVGAKKTLDSITGNKSNLTKENLAGANAELGKIK
jgi:hypothetical protein